MAKGRHYRMLIRRPSSFTLVLNVLVMLSVVLLMLIGVKILSIPVISNGGSSKANDLSSVHLQDVVKTGMSESSVGLQNEVKTELGERSVRLNDHSSVLLQNDVKTELGERRDQWTEVISWEPRAFLYHNFLSKEECEYMIQLAKPHMKKSTVVDNATGKSKDSSVRTSTGTFLKRGQDKIIRGIEKRIADFTLIPVEADTLELAENGEGLQILHYEVGQKYEPHYDYFADEFNTKNGGQRMATVLMYLSDVEEGGETVFPYAKGNFSSVPWWNELSECGKTGLSIKPKMGDAILFWSMMPDATVDPLSLHGACPVIRGNKWASPKWLHVNEYKQ